MGKTAVATRRRHGRRSAGRNERRPPVFPAQRRAAREQAAKLARVSEKLTGKPARSGTLERRLPRPVKWLLWLGGAALASVLVGFALGLARPRTYPESQI